MPCSWVLSGALHLGGFWWLVVATMLIGYLLAPHGIWHLCAGAHADADPSGVGPRHWPAVLTKRLLRRPHGTPSLAFVVLIFLTFDSMSKVMAGSKRVPDYGVINKRIYYRHSDEHNMMVPVIGGDAPLFGKKLSGEEAAELVSFGKKVIRGRNGMNCHTLPCNGAYYAPDLTKAGGEGIR